MGAKVSKNSINQFEAERVRAASLKEEAFIDRMCDGRQHAWRPDLFFSEELQKEDLPWPTRPSDILADPGVMSRVVAAYEASKHKAKKSKKKYREKKVKRSKEKD